MIYSSCSSNKFFLSLNFNRLKSKFVIIFEEYSRNTSVFVNVFLILLLLIFYSSLRYLVISLLKYIIDDDNIF